MNYMQQPMQNPGIQIAGNMNGLSVVLETADQYRNGNVVTAPAEGNGNGINVNPIRCYNCQGVGHYASNWTVKPRKRDAAYLQQQLSIAQKEEAGIQSTQEESNFMATVGACEETKRENANCIVENNLQQASTSGTQTDKAPVYDSDGSAEILEPILKPHQVPQNDSNVIPEVPSVEQGGGTVEQHPANVEETRAYHESLFHNLAAEVEKVNSVNRKMKEKIVELTTELARYKNQESSSKQIMALNAEILNLNKQLSKEKSTVSSLQEEKKRLKSDFKIREDELLDKQIQLENKVKELDNILVKTGQSIQTMHMLSPKPNLFYLTKQKMALGYQNPFYLKQSRSNRVCIMANFYPPVMYDSEETLELAQESRLKMQLLNKEIKPTNYTKIDHLSGVFVSQTAKSREELYLSNNFKTENVSKSISIPNEEFSDDTTPSVARKFLNKVKSTIVTLQRVVKQKMTLEIYNWSSSAHQEIHKIVKDENFHIVNQVDARVKNFEIQYLKEATKFVRDFQYLANEADESLAKHKALELEIERLLRAVVSQDIMSIVQNNSIADTSNLQTKLERTKERFENCIIKKENEYAKLWNDWYKKCEECKYDKFLYDKAYNDMQQKIERLQAQLGDHKGKNKDTSCVSDTLDPLPQKLENENVELEFQVRNYEREKAHLNCIQEPLRAQLFDKVSEQKDTTRGTSANIKFAKQSILGKPPSPSRPKLYAITPLPKSTVFPKVGVFRIDPHKTSRNDNFVPNKHAKASVRTKPITVSQPHIITKNDVPSKSKSSRLSNNLENIEENHRNLQSSLNLKHMSSDRNNIRLAIRNAKSEVVCAMCKQCLITVNHDVCVLNYVNDINSRAHNKNENVSNVENQKKHKPKVWKPKKVGSKERLALPKPSTPRSCLRWSPTKRNSDLKRKIIATSESACQSDSSKGDNACTSNPQEPISRRFPNSTFSMTVHQNWFDTLLTPLLFEYKPKDKDNHGDIECDS
ncbi:hypothetical protein Tco_0272312 [Tanacetum coccineum]